MSDKRLGLRFFLFYFVIALAINLISVPLHELGHAVVYMAQGYEVVFHLTSADPIGGPSTVLGAAGGVIANLIFGALFLLL